MATGPTAITIGNFDGVHVGHVQLVRTARAATGDDGQVIVLSFDPHPNAILHPQAAPQRLSRLAEREHWLRQAGADQVVFLNPTREFLHQPPDQFLETIVRPYNPAVIVEGPDFHFGRKRAGSVDTLRGMESTFGYRTIVIDPVEITLGDHSRVRASSSMIRWLLAHGRIFDANRILGRPHHLAARVQQGEQRGRQLNIPTANIDHEDVMLPADGIYGGIGHVENGRAFPAAISIGLKPTFNGSQRVCEAHLIGYEGSLDDYGWTLNLQFHTWIREPYAFPDAAALVKQIHRDIKTIEHYFNVSKADQHV